MSKTWHVAPDAPSDGDGSPERPWRLEDTVHDRNAAIRPGHTVLLRGGSYPRPGGYRISVSGEPGRPITFAAYPGEIPVIDGGISRFRASGNSAWQPVSEPAGRNVYESVEEFESPGENPWFGGLIRLTGEPRPGWYPLAVHNEPAYLHSDIHIWKDAPRYLGPGLAYNKVSKRIHIRLENSTPEAQAERPDVKRIDNLDPCKAELVIGAHHRTAFEITGSHLRFRRLWFLGHRMCWYLSGAPTDLRFIECTGEPYYFVARLDGATNVKILGGWYDGHMHSPTWWVSYVDIKGATRTDKQPPADRMRKCAFDLGSASDVELGPSPTGERMVIRQFFDGILAEGPLRNITVHGVWFDEMWDDAWQQATNTANVHYYDNVHFGAGPSRDGAGCGRPDGSVFIHDNIVDTTVRPIFWYRGGREEVSGGAVREPIAFSGHLTRGVPPMSPWKLYYNTMVTGAYPRPEQSSLVTGRFGTTPVSGQAPHEVYNNIFIVRDGAPLLRLANADSELEVFDGDCLWSDGQWQLKNGPYREIIAACASLNPEKQRDLTTLAGLKASKVPPASAANGRHRWYAASIEVDPQLDASYVPREPQVQTGAADISSRGWPGASRYRAGRGARLTAPFPAA